MMNRTVCLLLLLGCLAAHPSSQANQHGMAEPSNYSQQIDNVFEFVRAKYDSIDENTKTNADPFLIIAYKTFTLIKNFYKVYIPGLYHALPDQDKVLYSRFKVYDPELLECKMMNGIEAGSESPMLAILVLNNFKNHIREQILITLNPDDFIEAEATKPGTNISADTLIQTSIDADHELAKKHEVQRRHIRMGWVERRNHYAYLEYLNYVANFYGLHLDMTTAEPFLQNFDKMDYDFVVRNFKELIAHDIHINRGFSFSKIDDAPALKRILEFWKLYLTNHIYPPPSVILNHRADM